MTDAIVARWENLTDAGRRFLAQGDVAQAEESFRAAVSLADGHANGLPMQAAALEAIAQLKLRQQAHTEAEGLFRSALALRERAFGPDHPVVAITLNGLAAAYAARGAFAEAEGVLRRALAALQDDPAGQRELAVTLSALAKLYFRQGDYERAEPLLLDLLAVKQQELGRDHPEVAAVLTSLAALRGAVGRHDHAEQLLRKALAIREGAPKPNDAAVATLRSRLADAIAAQGRQNEAAALRAPVVPTPQPQPRPAPVARAVVAPEPPTPPAAVAIEPAIQTAQAPPSSAASRPVTPAIPTPADAAPASPKVPDGAALFAAAAALALDEFEVGAKPAPPAPPAPRAPMFDPKAPLWPRTDRTVQGSNSRPAPERLAPAPLLPVPPAARVVGPPPALLAVAAPARAPSPWADERAVLPVTTVPDLATEIVPVAPAGAADIAPTSRRAPRRVPRVALPSVRLTARHKRAAAILVVAAAGIFAVGEVAARMQDPRDEAPPAPPEAVAEVPDRPVDEDDPSRLPSLTGDAIGWVQPAPSTQPRQAPGRVRGGEVARMAAATQETSPEATSDASARAEPSEGRPGPTLPRAPSVRLDLRSVDERVRAAAQAVTEETVVKMPALSVPDAPRRRQRQR